MGADILLGDFAKVGIGIQGWGLWVYIGLKIRSVHLDATIMGAYLGLSPNFVLQLILVKGICLRFALRVSVLA